MACSSRGLLFPLTLWARASALWSSYPPSAARPEAGGEAVSQARHVGHPAPAARPPKGAYRQKMINSNDLQYHIPIKIGGTTLQGIVDTGSFELVVFSKRCTTCRRASAYDERWSPSFRKGHRDRIHSYGSGTCKTQDGYDKVELGYYNTKSQAMWLAVDCSMPLLQDATFNAIVGIAPPGQPEYAARTRIQKITSIQERLHKKKLKVPPELEEELKTEEANLEDALGKPSMMQNFRITTFSTCFGREKRSPAYMIWNDTTREGMPGVLKVPVIGVITWSIALHDVGLVTSNGEYTALGCSEQCSAVIDTGSSLLGVPSFVFNGAIEAIKSAVPNLNCNDLSAFPDLTFQVGGHTVRFPPESYIGSVVGRLDARVQNFMRMDWLLVDGGIPCQLLLMDLGAQKTKFGPLFILGMPFFREYYTTFSLGRGGGEHGDRSIFISPAGSTCEPDIGPDVRQYMVHRQTTARRLNASEVLAPHWQVDEEGLAVL